LLRRPGAHAHIHGFRFNLSYFALWDDPEFLALANDPANIAPLPFDWKEPGT
jgi:hypothetical protein